MQALTPYDALGGADAVRALVDRFYELMDEWPETFALRQMHPPDLGHARQSLYEFLSGWLGGPPLYIEKNGHPRLRMRHMPYAIGYAERDQWMMCMRTALTERVSDLDLRAALIGAFAQMADHMVNVSAASPATPTHPLESR
jgi:hemoglobin